MCNLVDVQMMRRIYIKMVDIQMLIITYMLFMVCYDIRCTCATLWRILHSPMIRVGQHCLVWMDTSNIHSIHNCTNFQMYSSIGINLHDKVRTFVRLFIFVSMVVL